MKQGITIQERLKNLRTERHLKLEELAELTEISKSALDSYENDEMEEDTTLKALQASQIQEEDYFCHVTHKEWNAILHDIRPDHEADAESAPDDSNTLKMIEM